MSKSTKWCFFSLFAVIKLFLFLYWFGVHYGEWDVQSSKSTVLLHFYRFGLFSFYVAQMNFLISPWQPMFMCAKNIIVFKQQEKLIMMCTLI